MMKLKQRLDSLTAHIEDELLPLWVGGLALACMLVIGIVGRGVFGLQSEAFEWTLYLTLGTLFPLLLLIVSRLSGTTAPANRLIATLKLCLIALCVVMSVLLLSVQHKYYIYIISAAHLALIYAFQKNGFENNPAWMVTLVFMVIVSWAAALPFLWWGNPFDIWFTKRSNIIALYRLVVFMFCLLLVMANLADWKTHVSERFEHIRLPQMHFPVDRVANIVAIVLLALASLRSDRLFDNNAYFHWGAIVGPAEMVRQGGWLLWDVPSQYGFLSTLAIAWFPAATIWQSLYVLNSLLLLASALPIFFLFRSLRGGLINYCFALGITLCTVFFLAGWPGDYLVGPHANPSHGAFRFFWCYALFGVLLWELKSKSEHHSFFPVLGSTVWLLGTLWSAESAVYCAAVWLPAYFLLVWRRVLPEGSERQSSKVRVAVNMLSFLSLPPLLLLVAVAGINAYYKTVLGHAPEWSAYFEYAFSFSSGFATLPVEMDGAVLTLFLVFCLSSTVAAYFLSQNLKHPALSIIAGTWGAVWVSSCYYISRSHQNNITILSPIICLQIAALLYLFMRYPADGKWRMLVKTGFVPILTIMLTATLGTIGVLIRPLPGDPSDKTWRYTPAPDLGYQRDVNRYLPVVDDSLLSLMREAQVKITDPMVFNTLQAELSNEQGTDEMYYGAFTGEANILPALPETINGETLFHSPPQTWLPTMPMILFAPLKYERRQIYMARFTERVRLGGWLIQSKKLPSYTASTWFGGQLNRTHTPTKTYENDDWQLIWFQYNGESKEN